MKRLKASLVQWGHSRFLAREQLPDSLQGVLRSMIFSHAYIGVVGGFAALLGLILVEWEHVSHLEYAFEWAATIFCLILSRLCWVLIGDRGQEQAPESRCFIGYYTSSVIEGFGWGLSAYLFFPDDVIYQAFMIVVLISLAVAALPVFSGSYSLYALFSGAIIVTLATKLATSSFVTYQALVILSPVLFGVLLVVASRMNALLIDTLLLNDKNEQLLKIEAASKNNIVEFSEKLNAKTLEVEKVNSKLRELVSLVSHDLRNQLVTLCQFSEFLSQDKCPPYEEAYIVEMLRQRSKKSLSLVDDLLQITGVELKPSVLKQNAAHLGESVENALDCVWALAEKKGVIIETQLEEERCVFIDSERLEQVLNTLIANAIEYTPPQGVVTVRSMTTEQGLRVEILDSGAGINPHRVEELFGGADLVDLSSPDLEVNLPVAQKILHAHGALLEASNQESRGCSFAFTLPWGE